MSSRLYPPAVFPPAPTPCWRDQCVEPKVVFRGPVRFTNIGPLDVIEVEGVPAWRCPGCKECTYDLALLGQIERLLHGRVSGGEYEMSYHFRHLEEDILASP